MLRRTHVRAAGEEGATPSPRPPPLVAAGGAFLGVPGHVIVGGGPEDSASPRGVHVLSLGGTVEIQRDGHQGGPAFHRTTSSRRGSETAARGVPGAAPSSRRGSEAHHAPGKEPPSRRGSEAHGAPTSYSSLDLHKTAPLPITGTYAPQAVTFHQVCLKGRGGGIDHIYLLL